MSKVDQIAKVGSFLQDISIKDEDIDIDDLTPILPKDSAFDSNASVQDIKLFQLLELVDEYEQLANKSYRLDFINGYLNLSRANYGHINRKYSSISYDLRPYKAVKEVGYDKGFVLRDLLQEKREEDERKEEEELLEQIEKVSEKGADEGLDKITEDEVTEVGNYSKLSSRFDSTEQDKSTGVASGSNKFSHTPTAKSNIIELDLTIDIEDELPLRDPVHQFGGLVSYQLRQSKVYFESSLANIIKVLNLRTKIDSLIKEIEEFEKSRNDELNIKSNDSLDSGVKEEVKGKSEEENTELDNKHPGLESPAE